MILGADIRETTRTPDRGDALIESMKRIQMFCVIENKGGERKKETNPHGATCRSGAFKAQRGAKLLPRFIRALRYVAPDMIPDH